MGWVRGRRPRAADQDGAAAVEFALVSSLLFLLVFAILDYGLWFNDSLNLRQGVREGARVGVVQNFTATSCTQTDPMQKLACKTKAQIGAVTGTAYVKIVTPDAAGWKKLFDGKTLDGWKSSFDKESSGKIHVKDGAIVLEKGQKMTGVTYAGKDFPKTDYEVVLEGKRVDGRDFFAGDVLKSALTGALVAPTPAPSPASTRTAAKR